MTFTYSAKEANARFSEVLKHVREGRVVNVTYHGTPVAEIRPISHEPFSLEKRIAELEKRGAISRAKNPSSELKLIANRPGAVERFLKDRNRY